MELESLMHGTTVATNALLEDVSTPWHSLRRSGSGHSGDRPSERAQRQRNSYFWVKPDRIVPSDPCSR